MLAPLRPRGAELLVLSPVWGRCGGAEHVLVPRPSSRYPEPAAGPVRAGAISRSHSGAIYNPNCCLQLVSELSRALWLRRVTSCHRGGDTREGDSKGMGVLGMGARLCRGLGWGQGGFLGCHRCGTGVPLSPVPFCAGGDERAPPPGMNIWCGITPRRPAGAAGGLGANHSPPP